MTNKSIARRFGVYRTLAASVTVSIALVGFAGGAVAAEADAGAQDEVAEGEIIVTAQRRSESLQKVPIAISAFSAEDIASRNITDLSQLRGAVPGLAISDFAGLNATNLIAIRGVAGQPLPIGAGQATAVYLDGVYLARPDAAFFALDDLERIEVLRGPQGTLYGRNATAGAINIITRNPGSEVEGGGSISYGNFDTVVLKGSLSGPLGGGLSAGISGSYDSRRGYFTNVVTGNSIDDREAFTVRGKLRYASPDSDFSATLAADLSNVDGHEVFRNQYSSFINGTFVGVGDPDIVSIDAASEARTASKTRSYGTSLTMDYEVSQALQLTSISSYRKLNSTSVYDGDGTAAPLLLVVGENENKSFNQEIRALITSGNFRATVGGNYYAEKSNFGGAVVSPAIFTFPFTPYDTSDLKAYALFSQAELSVSEQLTLVAGLRYNHETRDFTVDYSGAPGGTARAGNIRDSAFIPSVGVNFQASPDVLVYAKATKGYQAPGFNFQPGATAPLNTFDAEDLLAFESGVKAQMLDRRVTLNVAAFYYKYDDLQVRNITGTGLSIIENAADAKVKGIEASLQIRPVSGLTLSGQATYLSAKYANFCQSITAGTPQAGDAICALGRADRSGNYLNMAPEWSGSVGLDYRLPAGPGELALHVEYGFESNVYYTSANEPILGTGGWSKFDARIGYEFSEGPQIFIFGKNLTNDRYVSFAGRLGPTVVSTAINAPRTYGVGVSYHF